MMPEMQAHATQRPDLNPSVAPANRVTLEDAVNYTNRVRWLGSKNAEGSISNARDWLALMPKGIYLDEIDARLVSTVVERFLERRLSGATINRKLSALGAVLTSARQAGMTEKSLPPFHRMREKGGRTRVVTEAELAEMCKVSGSLFADLWMFLFDTGLRVSEALSLTAADVDAASRSVVVRESKSGSPRTVPLTLRAFDACGRGKRWPFMLTQTQVNREWSAARQVLGLTSDEQFVPHALRHTCATRLVKAAVPLPVVQRWLGHKNIQVTMRYAHVGDQQVKQAAQALETTV